MRPLKGRSNRETVDPFSAFSPISGSVVRPRTVHNHDLSPLRETELSAGDGSLLVDLSVPQGGYVALRKRGA